LTPSTTHAGRPRSRGAPGGDDDGLLGALQSLYLSPSRRPTTLGTIGCSLSRLFLAGFGGFAFLALALALLGFCNLSLVIFQRTTDTFVEVNPRRRFVGKETIRKRIRIRHHHARQLLPRVQLARRP
jgi:hypothetical protein